MNIIKRSSVDSSLHFTLGKKLGMSSDTAAYICFDFLTKRSIGSKTIAINTLVWIRVDFQDDHAVIFVV